jgi:hypothetical protein
MVQLHFAFYVREGDSVKKIADVICDRRKIEVELSGIEPLTSCMPCRRSPS